MVEKNVSALGDVELVEVLDLSTRTRGCLRSAKILTIGQLMAQAPATLLRLPRFGRGCLGEVETALARHGIRLAGTL